jgi:type II secretory ATPase GspE/PulE/Tfp pilus assembly ATPase PilB-like protein
VQRLGDNLVQVAVSDPTNLHTQDELRLALGMNCRLAVADADALASTINRTYRLSIAVTDAPPEELLVDDAAAAESALDLVNALIGRAVNEGSSDLHIDPQARDVLVRFRIDGVMRDDAPIDKRSQNALAARIKDVRRLYRRRTRRCARGRSADQARRADRAAPAAA